jgi:hypothetical protein
MKKELETAEEVMDAVKLLRRQIEDDFQKNMSLGYDNHAVEVKKQNDIYEYKIQYGMPLVVNKDGAVTVIGIDALDAGDETGAEIERLKRELAAAKENTHMAVKIASQLVSFVERELFPFEEYATDEMRRYVNSRKAALGIIEDIEPDPEKQNPQVKDAGDEDTRAFFDKKVDDNF